MVKIKTILTYKKTLILISILAISVILLFHVTVVVSVRQCNTNRRMKADIARLKDTTAVKNEAHVSVDLQDFTIAVVNHIKGEGCNLIKLDVDRKKDSDESSLQEISIAFSGPYANLLKTLNKIDALIVSDLTPISCFVNVEKTADKKEYSIVARLKIQTIVAL